MKKTDCSRRQFLKILHMVGGLAVFPGILSCTKKFNVQGLSSLPDEKRSIVAAKLPLTGNCSVRETGG